MSSAAERKAFVLAAMAERDKKLKDLADLFDMDCSTKEDYDAEVKAAHAEFDAVKAAVKAGNSKFIQLCCGSTRCGFFFMIFLFVNWL